MLKWLITKITKLDSFLILLLISLFVLFILFIYNLVFSTSEGSWTKKKYYDLLSYPIHKDEKQTYNIIEKGESNDSKGEIECRRVLRKIFNKPFHKARPSFLNNPVTGGSFNLELDCYDSDLKIAVEYQGKQHYVYTPFFHKNKEHFLNQKYRDDMKRRMCKENNIKLIEVPYDVKIKEIENYIRQKL